MLNPLSQLDYEFVPQKDYRLEKISSRLRLAAYSEGFSIPPQLKPLVFKEAKPTAFSLATGEILLSEGMLKQLDDEAQLAAIIAHEYSHTLLNHFSELRSSSLISVTVEPELELGADELSIKLLDSAGYPKIAALKALRAIHRQIRNEVSFETNELLNRRELNLASLVN